MKKVPFYGTAGFFISFSIDPRKPHSKLPKTQLSTALWCCHFWKILFFSVFLKFFSGLCLSSEDRLIYTDKYTFTATKALKQLEWRHTPCLVQTVIFETMKYTKMAKLIHFMPERYQKYALYQQMLQIKVVKDSI